MTKSILAILSLFIFASLSTATLIAIPPQANEDFTTYLKNISYPYEVHTVVCQDGYILTYFRVQAKNTHIKEGLPVVFAHHGLLDSADSFIINDEDQAPGLILADKGYDVWFGNNRGNRYSLGHVDPVNFNSSDSNSDYWDFSWQEFSIYDLPAGFDYIASKTGQKINYVGHSEGTTIMFAALARRDSTVLSHLNKFVALAPAVFLQHSSSPIVKIGAWVKAGYILKDWDDFVKNKKFGHMKEETRKKWEELCVVSLAICIERIKLLTDADTDIDNVHRLTVTTGHFPAGTSVQNMLYWQQMYNKGGLPMYDYGTAGNLEYYGTKTPPNYDLSQINVPVYMFVGQYDELAPLEDTATLRNSLTGSPYVQYQSYPLGHSSFMWGLDVAGYMNDVIHVLNS